MMKAYYLSTKYDGFGGPLLSLALYSSSDDKHFYEVIDRPITDPTVVELVAPVFNKVSILEDNFTNSLRQFLMDNDECHIIADRPEDFMYLFLRCFGPDGWMLKFNFTAQFLTSGPPLTPEIQHNALSYAEAFYKWHGMKG